MAKYDFSPEARERTRLQGIKFRAEQKIRMENDPAYAEKIHAARVAEREKRKLRDPDYYKNYRLKKLEEDPEFDRKKNQTRKPANQRKYQLRAKYGLTLDDFQRLFDEQNGICAICPRELELGGHKTHVDHCHETGKVRGLLCFHCNTTIGKVNEDQDILARMAAYLREHKT